MEQPLRFVSWLTPFVAGASILGSSLVAQEPAAPPPADGITVTHVEIAGIEDVTPAVELPRRLPLRPGAPYTIERVEDTEAVILRALWERGHPYAAVTISGVVDERAGTAQVVLDVEPGPSAVFGEVVLDVPAPLRERDVLPRIAFAPGEPFRPSALERTRILLTALPGIEDALIELRGLATGATVLPTVVTVVIPDRLHHLSGRVSMSSIDCLELVAGWRHEHFLGGPRAFSFSGGFSNLFAAVADGGFPCAGAGEGPYAQPNYFVTTTLFQPVGADPPSAVEARTSFQRRTASQSYLLHGFGLQLAFLREVRGSATVRLAYSPERNELRAAGHYYCVNFGACTGSEIDRLSEARWLAPVEASIRWLPITPPPLGVPGTRDDPAPGELRWLPHARAGVAGAGQLTGSQFAYLRGIVEGSVTRLLTPRSEAAARVRLGALTGQDALPPQVRFYSGGANTVRGAPQNLLGPLVLVIRPEDATEAGCDPEPGGCPPDFRPHPDRVTPRPRGGVALAEASLEARLWISSSIQIAGFADAGVVRSGDGLGEGNGAWDGMVAPGLGIRWVSPMGPIRVDIGYDARPSRRLPVLLQDPAQDLLVTLGHVTWEPYTHDRPSAWTEFRRRLQLHLAMGQPF